MSNRCPAFTKTGKKCRCKLQNDMLFCCKSHEPINDDIKDTCFMCINKIDNTHNIIYLKCKHAFHKECYMDWLNVSTYDKPICMVCGTEAFKEICKLPCSKKYKPYTQYVYEKIIDVKNIKNILKNK